MKVGQLIGSARVFAGEHVFEGIAYRIDVLEEAGRRRLESGNIALDAETVSALQGSGDSVIELGGILGQFSFVITSVPDAEIRITGPSAVQRTDGGTRSPPMPRL
jgi:hypothetical protein